MNPEQLLATIAQLAEQLYGQPVYIDLDTGQLLRYDRADDTYYPIVQSDTPTPVWHFSPERLAKASDFISGNIGKNRTENGQTSEQNRTNQRIANEQAPDGKRPEYKELLEQNWQRTGSRKEKRRQQLFNYYSLTPFHDQYSEPIRSIALNIEDLTFELLQNTQKQQTIEKILQRYRQAQTYAEKGDEYHLRQILERLEGQRNKQQAMHRVNLKMQRRKQRKKILKIAGGTAALLLATFLLIYFKFLKPSAADQLKQDIKAKAEQILKPYDYYLIAGSYTVPANAERAKKHYVRRGYLQTQILVDTTKKVYRVAIWKTNNLDSARAFARKTGTWILKQ